MTLAPIAAMGQGKRADETVSKSKKMVNKSCEARRMYGMAAQGERRIETKHTHTKNRTVWIDLLSLLLGACSLLSRAGLTNTHFGSLHACPSPDRGSMRDATWVGRLFNFLLFLGRWLILRVRRLDQSVLHIHGVNGIGILDVRLVARALPVVFHLRARRV